MNSQNQPQKSDAVLGGHSPNQAVVMGGIRGIRTALNRIETIPQRQEILQSALHYGREGIEIILEHLRYPVKEVREFAYSLLSDRSEDYIREALALLTPSGTYYLDLQKLLLRHQWGAANAWTQQTIKQLCHAHSQINSHHMQNLPCPDLLVIDRLWHTASQGKFSFASQGEIWQQCSQWRWDQNWAMAMFGDRVGWRVHSILFNTYHWKRYDELTFSIRAPKGHLPWINGIFVIKAIHDRLLSCKN